MSSPRPSSRLALSASVGLALVAAAYISLLGVGAAAAQQSQMPKPTAEQRSACIADFQRLCAGVQRGDGRVMQCLQSHAEELSAPCGELVSAAAAAQAAS